MPTTTVRIVPAWEPLNETIEVRGEPTLLVADARRMMAPVRTAQTSVEGSQVLAATGRKPILHGKAEGWVTLINRASRPMDVPRATVVSTANGIRFETIEDAHLGPDGGAAKVGIIALEPGEKGNIHRNEIVRVDGVLARQVDALNEDDLTGGGMRDVPVVTSDDRRQVKELLVAKLEQQAIAELKKDRALKPGDEFLPGSLYFNIQKEEYDHESGDQAKSVVLTLQAQVRGSAVNVGEVTSMVEKAWQPALKPGYTVPASTVVLGQPSVKAVDPISGALALGVPITGTAVARIDREQVERSLRWMSEPEIERYLTDSLPLAEPPAAVIMPDWAERAVRVTVVVEEPGHKRDD
ncbi:MAG: baseplate J/gp47 family protein [Bacteroidetes bacterium]|nr:baseplate J/gp47 family protein [Bacteroidota bacterium]MCL5026122.1 baseplate J/gp47 family protein [Chloroflexota bacterium]